ncbi:MAG: PKD domain-containing protein [Flavobacteriales bacterium]|nr:PKD domain-containing protein [Flavobacteriales bacterium]
MRSFLSSLLLVPSFVLVNSLSAQVVLQPPPTLQVQHNTEPCGFDALHQQLMQSDPVYRDRTLAFDAAARAQGGNFTRSLSTYKIPVVVHVMETGTGLTALTDGQIRNAIKALNQRFRKVAGTAGFGSGVDVGIEFVLAVRDPNGNCTTGITRTNMTGNATYMASGVFRQSVGITDAALKALDVWDQTRYYNIWAVSEIDGNDGGSGIQGFAYFASSHGTALDGCVMLANQLADPTSTVLTHEIGHALDVYHTFEGDANGTACPNNSPCGSQGDQVCDTPPHIRSASDCNTGGTNVCDANSSNSLFVVNYMDYSSSDCQSMFSSGQAARMTLALTTTRASFLTANGNTALVPPGAATMDILCSAATLCGTGQSVTLYDNSRCVPNTWLPDSEFPGISFSWTISNGVNTYNSTAQNPTFTLASAGVYNATLTTTSAQGVSTVTENGIVVVATAPVAACTPTSANPSANYGLTVSRVKFNTLDNSTSTGINGVYQNFSCSQSTVVARNGSYPFSITVNGSTSNGTEVYEAYIDYNNNGTFENPAELISLGSSAVVGTVVSTNVTIPNTAVQNTLLRMRVYGEAGSLSASERTCGVALLVGDVEDYGVYVSSSLAAVSIAASPSTTITYGTNVTFTPTPTNGGGAPTYSWFKNGLFQSTGATYSSATLLPGDQVYALLYSNLAGVVASPATSNTLTMTVTGPPQSDFKASTRAVCVGSSVTFTDISLLTPTSWSWSFPGGTPSTSTAQNPTVTYNTAGTYNVTLTASNGLGTGTTTTKTAYITVYALPTAGCTVTRSTAPAGFIGITNVSLNTINNATAYNDAVMSNFLCSQTTTLNANTTYAINVATSPVNTQWVRAYIDYNRDGDFIDIGEEIFAPANGINLFSGNFTTPVAPQSGLLMRMRVITDFVNTVPGPCTTPLQYGQVEEYGIVFNTPLNTAPVLNASASPALGAVNEDAGAPVGAVGTLVSALVDLAVPSGQVDNVTDPDAGALLGIALTAADATNGVWHYSINGGTNWTALGVPTGTAARLLAADGSTRLYLQPNANFNGTVASAITFRAWDRTTSTTGSTADASVNGGTTAYSTATDIAPITVTAVNDAPTGSNLNTAENYNEDIPLNLVDIVTADIDNVNLTVTLTLSNPAAGALNTGTSGAVTSTYVAGTGVWTASGAIANVNILLAGVTFTPAANFNSTFTIATSVSDGVAPALTGSKTLTGTAVNDAPVNTVPVAQTTPMNVALALTGVNALATADLDAASASVQISLSVTNGVLTLAGISGLSFTIGDGTSDASMVFTGNLTNVNAALANVLFTPTTNFNGVAVLSLTTNDQGNTGTGGPLSDADQVNITVTPVNVVVPVKAMLDGPYVTANLQMNDGLRTLGFIPAAHPYGAAPWNHPGSETVAPAVLAVTGNNAIVDWVLVELRASGDNTTVVASAAGLLQRDGDVVATNGTSSLTFNAPPASYFVVLRHRNHLGVMSATALPLTTSSSAVDFTLSGTATFGTAARKDVSGMQVLWAGDVSADGLLQYTGNGNDRDPILAKIGGTVPTNTALGYWPEDCTLDGVVQYTGNGNDRDPILQNIGGTVPTNTRSEQVP